MNEPRGECLSRQRFLRVQKAVVIRKSYLKLVVIETTEKTQEAWERISERLVCGAHQLLRLSHADT